MPSKPSREKVLIATKVLEKISAYDAYFTRPADSVILAWASALTLANVPEDIALDAVDHMYLNVSSADFRPLPGMLLQHCREIRRERFDAEHRAKEQAEEPDERITLQEWEERHGEKFPRPIGKSIPFPEDEPNPKEVRCPHCRALPGDPCVIAGTGSALTQISFHYSRIDAAKKAAVQ